MDAWRRYTYASRSILSRSPKTLDSPDASAHNAKKGEPTPFPVSRGTLPGIGLSGALLWTHGSVRCISSRQHFQGARGTPRPLRLVRHAGHG
jgi:hypothetical protein